MYYPNIFNEGFYNDLLDEVVNFPFDYGKRIRNEITDKKRCTTDIKEFEDYYELDMEFPGFSKEEIKEELKNGYLLVSAEHKEANETADPEKAENTENTENTEASEVVKAEPVKYICRERFCGKSERSFYVGKELSKEDIKAHYENGLLTLQIPKKVEKPEKENEVISIQ